MKLFFSFIVTALTFFSLEAQQLSPGGNSWVANFKKASDEVNNQEEKLKYSEIKGTPYYNPDFESAKFDDTPTVAPIRYNTFLDVVEILIDNNIYEIPREATPKKFTFTKTNERLIVLDTHDEYAGYFFEIADGKYKILKKRRYTLLKVYLRYKHICYIDYPKKLSKIPAATADPITPATFGPIACINK